MTAEREYMFWHSNKDWYRIDEVMDKYELTEKPQSGHEKVLNSIKK